MSLAIVAAAFSRTRPISFGAAWQPGDTREVSKDLSTS
jgi:hypothetical protein